MATFFTSDTPSVLKRGEGATQFYVDVTQAFDTVAYYEKFKIVWEFTIKGKNAANADWSTAGQTTNRMFISYKAPATKEHVYISALWQGCQAAAGATKDTSVEDVVKKLWSSGNSNFAMKNVTTIGKDKLYYYQNWEHVKPGTKEGELGFTYRQMLASKDGICDAWGTYFDFVLKVQGVTTSSVKIIVPTSNKYFMVNNWAVAQGKENKDNTYYNVINPTAKGVQTIPGMRLP